MKLMAIVVFLILSALGARACAGSSSPSSPLNPVNVARNGIAGVCANEQAVSQDEGSDQTPATALSPSQLAQEQASDPAGLNALQQTLGGNLSCPTPTTVAGADGG